MNSGFHQNSNEVWLDKKLFSEVFDLKWIYISDISFESLDDL